MNHLPFWRAVITSKDIHLGIPEENKPLVVASNFLPFWNPMKPSKWTASLYPFEVF
jgi:hypothetical protein